MVVIIHIIYQTAARELRIITKLLLLKDDTSYLIDQMHTPDTKLIFRSVFVDQAG